MAIIWMTVFDIEFQSITSILLLLYNGHFSSIDWKWSQNDPIQSLERYFEVFGKKMTSFQFVKLIINARIWLQHHLNNWSAEDNPNTHRFPM